MLLCRSTAGWWKNPFSWSCRYSLIELHAQMVCAECDFLIGLLSILKSVILLHKRQDQVEIESSELMREIFPVYPLLRKKTPTVAHFYGAECMYTLLEPNSLSFSAGVSLLITHFARLARAGLSFMSAHKSFEKLMKIVSETIVTDCVQSHSNLLDDRLFCELKSGVYVVMGAMKLFSAVLPAKVLSLLSIMHKIDADKTEGIELLRQAQSLPAMRSVLATNCILAYNLTFLQFVGPVSEFDKGSCRLALKSLAEELGQTSFLYEFYRFRQQYLLQDPSQYQCLMFNFDRYPSLLQVRMIFIYESMWYHATVLNWQSAAMCAGQLACATQWSRAYFIYLYVLFRLQMCHESGASEERKRHEYKLLLGKFLNIKKFNVCESQIKSIAVDRLAMKRAKMLTNLGAESSVVYLIEAMFWHDELRSIYQEDFFCYLEKVVIYKKQSLSDDDLEKHLNSEIFFHRKLAVVLVCAFILPSKRGHFKLEDIRSNIVLENCFRWLLFFCDNSQFEDCDIQILSLFLLLRISVIVLLTEKHWKRDLKHRARNYLKIGTEWMNESELKAVMRLKLGEFKKSVEFLQSTSVYAGRVHFFVRNLAGLIDTPLEMDCEAWSEESIPCI